MKRLQDELAASIEVGPGTQPCSYDLRHDVGRVNIDPSLLSDDKDMRRLVAAAFSDAHKVETTTWGDQAASPPACRCRRG
jgi:DNA-binding protein YbaB